MYKSRGGFTVINAKNNVNYKKKKELFFGIVGSLGTNLEDVIALLKECLYDVNFDTNVIVMSSLLNSIQEYKDEIIQSPEDDRISSYMDLGNKLRNETRLPDVLSILSVVEVKRIRQSTSNERVAFIFKSLKNPHEEETLRKIYRDSFLLISVYTPRDVRMKNLAFKIAKSRNENYPDNYLSKAYSLLQRDESEQNDYGQNVQDTYPKADIFLDASNLGDLNKFKFELKRCIELIFGNTFHTPTIDEYGMFNAFASAKRSGSLARQVGAAIINENGDIVATGMNEIPKLGGGLYSSESGSDPRNYVLGYDPNDQKKFQILIDLFKKLFNLKIITESNAESLFNSIRDELKNTYVMNIIEYTREVHAEMAAIISASRNTISINNCKLYTTTFPCHDCAKHIIAAGIKKVIYIDPYPKSLASELYSDFIRVNESHTNVEKTVEFESFIGVSPKRYLDFFEMTKRKNSDGTVKKWDRSNTEPRFMEPLVQYDLREADYIKKYTKKNLNKNSNNI